MTKERFALSAGDNYSTLNLIHIPQKHTRATAVPRRDNKRHCTNYLILRPIIDLQQALLVGSKLCTCQDLLQIVKGALTPALLMVRRNSPYRLL
jgi:hypothetical protein